MRLIGDHVMTETATVAFTNVAFEDLSDEGEMMVKQTRRKLGGADLFSLTHTWDRERGW